MSKLAQGIKMTEENGIITYKFRTKIGTVYTVRINTNNFIKKSIIYVKPGDKRFDKLMSADIHEVCRCDYTNDTIEDSIYGRVHIEVAYSIGNGTIKRAQIFYGVLKLKAAKVLSMEV